MDERHKHDENKPTGTPSWELSSAWSLKRGRRRCEPFSSQFGYGQKGGGFSIAVESATTKAGNVLTSWVAIRYSRRTSPHIQIGPRVIREWSLLKDTEGYQVTPLSVRCSMKKRGWEYCSLSRALDAHGWALFVDIPVLLNMQIKSPLSVTTESHADFICVWFMLQGRFRLNSHSTYADEKER